MQINQNFKGIEVEPKVKGLNGGQKNLWLRKSQNRVLVLSYYFENGLAATCLRFALKEETFRRHFKDDLPENRSSYYRPDPGYTDVDIAYLQERVNRIDRNQGEISEFVGKLTSDTAQLLADRLAEAIKKDILLPVARRLLGYKLDEKSGGK